MRKKNPTEPDVVWLERQREIDGILAHLEERIRLANERDARRRARLRRLTLGLPGRG